MARRASASGGMNLDSLLDTLTNVVGILLIILIFSVLSGADTVKRIKGFVDEISDQQLQQAAAQNQELRQLLDEQRQKWEEYDNQDLGPQISLQRQKELIAQLKTETAKLAAAKIDPAELKKQLEQRRTQALALEKAINEKEKLIADLRARLAEPLPKVAEPRTKAVKLPEPREPPKEAKALVFICSHGRMVPVDVAGLQKQAQQVWDVNRRTVVRPDPARAGVVEGIDSERLTSLFEKRFVGNRYCQLKIRVGGDAKPYLSVQPRADAGDRTEFISQPNSLFNFLLRQADPRVYYLEFRVYGDSYDTYLEARNVASRRGFAAGWIPCAEKSEYLISFGIDLKWTCMGRKPAPPGPPPPANRPPPPRDVVD
jgi:hypothetical protein